MQLIIISGRSGSGKSTALHVLEDAGYNCIDNFPAGLLPALVHNALGEHKHEKLAVSIDARNSPADIQRFPEILLSIDRMDLDCELLFLDAHGPTLVKRFSETRRRHPLSNETTDLRQAIETEQTLLENIADLSDLKIDTTNLTSQELVSLISTRVLHRTPRTMSLLFRSFGFKFGVPVDADLVFDVRCLPNPYLSQQKDVDEMYDDIKNYLERWLPKFKMNNRIYMTVAIGCTGGQHRSVYLAERLNAHFLKGYADVLVRHRELTTKTVIHDD